MARATIRIRRQLTLPADVCRALGLGIGDSVDLHVEDGSLRVTPSKRRALDALGEIQAAFARSGIGEDELLEEARRVRDAVTRERHGETRST